MTKWSTFLLSVMLGMRWSSEKGCMVIIADHTKSLYDDRWEGDVLRYTGMGKLEDQTLTSQDRRLAEQPKTGIAVHLFEVFEQNKYFYVGRVAVSGDVGTEWQPDDRGRLRRVFVFPLKLVMGQQPKPTLEQISEIRAKRQRQLRTKTLEELKKLADARGKQKPGHREVTTSQYDRDEAVADYVKRAAGGVCGLCRTAAPFEPPDGPYLECHHVVHLAEGGADSRDNAIALCPNCHRKMHVLNRRGDRELLLADCTT